MKIEGTVVEMRVTSGGMAVVVVEGYTREIASQIRVELPITYAGSENLRIGRKVNVEITLTTSF